MKKVLVISGEKLRSIRECVEKTGMGVLGYDRDLSSFLKAIEDCALVIADFLSEPAEASLGTGYAVCRGKTVIGFVPEKDWLATEMVYVVKTMGDLERCLQAISKRSSNPRPWGRPPPGESNA